ncbi:MAG TPA: aromatic ring-hydroxylating dioxygenase subunit alpha, partial [Dehalococcoidia bacterium]|nr:aromatic ring-hydroxylating dioxygenase subunit alpha [Dehalococcoidia bacterium]
EPPESNFKDKVRQTAYPCQEAGGIVWTYMGPRSTPPALPQFEMNLVPEEQRFTTEIMWRHCNWLQALEGCLDSSHVYFLHSRLRPEVDPELGVHHPDRNPHFEIVPTDWGLMYGARREQDAEHYYWRVTQYLFPYTLLFPSLVFWKGAIPGHMWVPVDDYNVLNWTFRYHPSEPYSAEEKAQGWGPAMGGSYLPPTTQPFGWTRPVGQRDNDYLLDPEIQRAQTFTGIPGVLLQDQAVTESMGPMLDRTTEHLGSADLVVIQARQLLLKHLNAYKKSGVLPPGVDQPELYRRRSASVILPKSDDWIAATKDWVDARPGAPIGVLGT